MDPTTAMVIDGQQAFGNHFKCLAIAVQRIDPDLLRAIDIFIKAGHRQATFLVLLKLIGQ